MQAPNKEDLQEHNILLRTYNLRYRKGVLLPKKRNFQGKINKHQKHGLDIQQLNKDYNHHTNNYRIQNSLSGTENRSLEMQYMFLKDDHDRYWQNRDHRFQT
eukprot:Lithocolla_globosa_v1_NODE_76_length_6846_cov_31.756737.p6 type:complete len:102 gc:universal NODE_76_length_6846_cov_31.756737:2195-2500(+)